MALQGEVESLRQELSQALARAKELEEEREQLTPAADAPTATPCPVCACVRAARASVAVRFTFAPFSRTYVQAAPAESDVAQRLKGWEYLLPADALQRGIVRLGDPSRVRSLLERAAAGEPQHLVFAGGSVTYWGSMHPLGWVERLALFFSTAFPLAHGQNHSISNAGIGAISSSMYEACMDEYMPMNGTLYVVDFTQNEPALSNNRENQQGKCCTPRNERLRPSAEVSAHCSPTPCRQL